MLKDDHKELQKLWIEEELSASDLINLCAYNNSVKCLCFLFKIGLSSSVSNESMHLAVE